ncbi:MAG: hypothetical protein HUJ54_08270, partial [Erysipelotrichaceae bacterium]|nr:hypothetical protein [Erysipelotrichaceae bacterium]
FAATPGSWSSDLHGLEKDFGSDIKRKTPELFKDRFCGEPWTGIYRAQGDLVSRLYESKAEYSTTGDPGSRSKKNSVNVSSTGLQYANNLKEVYETACYELAGLNDNGGATASDFMQHHDIQAMTKPDDPARQTPAVYNIMATRFKQPNNENVYDYNAFGLAFYDFKLEPLTGQKGEEVIQENVTKAGNVPERISVFANHGMADATYTMKAGKTETDTVSITDTSKIQTGTAKKFAGTTSINMKGALASMAEKAGCSQFAETIKQALDSETHTVSKEVSRASDTRFTVPAHTAGIVRNGMGNAVMRLTFNTPVVITFKTAVFSLAGTYRDNTDPGDIHADLSWTYNNCWNRSFFAEIGSNTTDAWDNLKARMNPAKQADDNLMGFTRLCGYMKKQKQNYTWDNPYTNRLDWAAVRQAAKRFHRTGLDAVSENVCERLPYMRKGAAVQAAAEIAETRTSLRPITPLASVELSKPEGASKAQDRFQITQGQTLCLSDLKLAGYDASRCPFYSFQGDSQKTGEWKLTDRDGKVLEKCCLGSIQKGSNDTMEFVPAAGQSGKVYAKYFVKDGAYSYWTGRNADQEMPVKSGDVQTPVIEITVLTQEEAFDGTVKINSEGTAAYQAGTPVDLDRLLDPAVYDSSGKYLDVPVKWQCRNRAVKIDGSKMSVPAPGTYQVRAQYGRKYSDHWADVQIGEPAAEESQLEQPALQPGPAEEQQPVQPDKKADENADEKTDPAKKQEEESVSQDADYGEAAAWMKKLSDLTACQKQIPEDLSGWVNSQISSEEKQEAFDWASRYGLFDHMDQMQPAADAKMSRTGFARMAFSAALRSGLAADAHTAQQQFDQAAENWAESRGFSTESSRNTVEKTEVLGFLSSLAKDLNAKQDQPAQQDPGQQEVKENPEITES